MSASIKEIEKENSDGYLEELAKKKKKNTFIMNKELTSIEIKCLIHKYWSNKMDLYLVITNVSEKKSFYKIEHSKECIQINSGTNN